MYADLQISFFFLDDLFLKEDKELVFKLQGRGLLENQYFLG